MINLTFKRKRLYSLFNKVHVYVWPTIPILLLIGVSRDIRGWLFLLFPIILEQYWFVTVFVALMIFAPFINILIHSLSQSNNLVLLLLLFIVTSLLPTLTFNATYNPGFYDLGIFITAYVAASVLRLYPSVFHWSKLLTVSIFFISSIIQFVFLFTINIVAIQSNRFSLMKYSTYLNSQESVFVFMAAFSLFIFFNQLKKFSIKIINIIASSTFGIYLIHTHFLVYSRLMNISFLKSIITTNNVFLFIILVIVTSMLVFIVCSIIDLIYSWFIKHLKIYYYLDKLNNLFYNLGKKLINIK